MNIAQIIGRLLASLRGFVFKKKPAPAPMSPAAYSSQPASEKSIYDYEDKSIYDYE